MVSNNNSNSIKIIPAWVHGVFDYIGGVGLLFAPELFGFADLGGAPVAIPRIIGAMILIQSFFTAYQLGVVKMLSMKSHLMNDYVASLFLAASPWIFGFADMARNVWVPHVAAGILIFVLSLLTEKVPTIHYGGIQRSAV